MSKLRHLSISKVFKINASKTHQNVESRLEWIVIVKLGVHVLPGHDDEGELDHDVVIDLGGLGHGVNKVAAVNKLAMREP